MESLLQAKSTAPKSQRVNYKKAAGIQMYAKLRNREINVEYIWHRNHSIHVYNTLRGCFQKRRLTGEQTGHGNRGFLIAQVVKNPPAVQEILVPFLGQEDLLEKG